jgi:antitoxin component YwqK of YwqJK toxin-antitoxin module
MINKVLILFLIILSQKSLAQIDTTIDFEERFYSNSKLVISNNFIKDKKDGFWIEYFDKNWSPSLNVNSKYYRLIQYDNGRPIGKVHDFYKSGKLQMVGQFESLEPEVKKGTFIWFEKNGMKSTIEYHSDSLKIETSYYKNGQLQSDKLFVRKNNRLSLENNSLYYKNGNLSWSETYDSNSYFSGYYSGRKNGTINSEFVSSNQSSTKTEENRKGNKTTKWITYKNSDSTTIEKYLDGKLIQSTTSILRKKKSKINTINYYEGDIGGSLGVIIVNDVYTVNGVKMTKTEYREYESKYDQIIHQRKKRHYYKYYDSDSLLIYSGYFKKVDLPCGIYTEYHPNGNPKVRGYYDNKGRKTSGWLYYDENGNPIWQETYKKGEKTKG